MDWTTIGYVAIASVVFSLHFIPIRYVLSKDIDIEPALSWVAGLMTIGLMLVEPLLLLAIFAVGYSIIGWGIGNFLISTVVIISIIGGPFLAKPLALRLFVAIPHYVRKFFADCKAYKTKLEITAPIKRSVYELMED